MEKLARILVCVVFMLGVFLLQDVFAAEKIVYVDLGLVFDGYEKTKDFDVKLEDTQKTEQERIDSKVDQIKELQDKLPLLSEEEKESKEGEIDGLTRDLQEFQRSAEMDLRSQRDEKLREILKDIQDTIKEVAKDKKYTFVLNERVLLYGDDNLNISDDILKKLNDSYTKK
ncbi:OmpH family outer membrane protein [bacterium]|nr:OmpH family outer membrane protein [bacterium]